MTASSMSSGTIAIIVAGSLIVGAALGAVITVLVNRNKKKKETEATEA
jgi:H+/Cl- antiporter ClcA